MMYYYLQLLSICLILAVGSTSEAFVFHNTKKSISGLSVPLSSTVDNSEKENVPITSQPSYNKNKMSESLPFLKCPPILAENMDVPGNVGFDPLQFVQDTDDLIANQEAEIKHARLAMLVCLLWSSLFLTYFGCHSRNEMLKFNSIYLLRRPLVGHCRSYGMDRLLVHGIFRQFLLRTIVFLPY